MDGRAGYAVVEFDSLGDYQNAFTASYGHLGSGGQDPYIIMYAEGHNPLDGDGRCLLSSIRESYLASCG